MTLAPALSRPDAPEDTAPPPHRDPAVITAAYDALAALRELLPSLVMGILVTDDGFEIARTDASLAPATPSGDHRLASMASSMQALSEAVARELALGTTRLSLIDANEGRAVFRRVDGHPIVLAAVVGDDESLGRATSITKRAVEILSIALDTSTTPASSVPLTAAE